MGILDRLKNDYKNTSHKFDDSDYEYNLLLFKKTIIHELVHFINHIYSEVNKIDYTKGFLAEGIAQYLSNQYEGKKDNFNYTSDEIINDPSCYGGRYLVTKYIMEEYRKDTYLEFLQNQDKAKTFIENNMEEYYNNIKRR